MRPRPRPIGKAVNPWVYRVYLAAGLGLAVVYAHSGSALGGVVYGLLGNAAAVAVLVGCVRHRPELSRFWWLIFTALMVNLAGDIVMGLHFWVFPHSTAWEDAQNGAICSRTRSLPSPSRRWPATGPWPGITAP